MFYDTGLIQYHTDNIDMSEMKSDVTVPWTIYYFFNYEQQEILYTASHRQDGI